MLSKKQKVLYHLLIELESMNLKTYVFPLRNIQN